jgi:hypothetical protein
MPRYYEFIESRLRRPGAGRKAGSWAAAIAAALLLALPIAGALYRGSFGGMEIPVAVTGIAVLAVAVADRLVPARRRSAIRGDARLQSGEALLEGAR